MFLLPLGKWFLSPVQAGMKNVVLSLMLDPRQSLKKHSSTRADRVERGRVLLWMEDEWFSCRQRGCQTNTDRSFPIHMVGEGLVGREEEGELQIQQSGIQMMMTGIDAPGWFFHKAIPPHHFLGGGVLLSQHSRDKKCRCVASSECFTFCKGIDSLHLHVPLIQPCCSPAWTTTLILSPDIKTAFPISFNILA